MQVPRLVAKKHGEIRVAVDHGLFQLGDVLNILELRFRSHALLGAASAQALQGIPSFFLPSDLDQPSRRLGEKPDSAEENQQENDLEGDGESPTESRLAAVNE